MLNRSALIVRPKQPYLDWAAGLDDSGIQPDVEGEQTVYLVPEIEDGRAAEAVLRGVFVEIFERELYRWHTDEAAWPTKRTFAMFKQWFRVEFHSIVEDLCGYEFVDDDDEV
jgi:hypothetical protein